MWNTIVELFLGYMGKGLIVGWFLVSVFYLFFREQRKQVRILFVYVPVILLLLFFNPLFAKLVYGAAGGEIYYRILWLIPMTVVIAYAAVHLYGRLKEKWKGLAIGVYAVLIVISGSYIYGNEHFSKAQNLYHVPQCVVDICDAIEVEGREVMAVFPEEMLQYVRQYSPVVCMPYGREQLVDRWGYYDELYQVMQAAVIDADKLAALSKERQCHYVILPQEKPIQGSLYRHDFELFASIDGYDIYRDTTVYIGL